jgi:signal transduction histidine kinase
VSPSETDAGPVRRYAWAVYLIAMTGLALLYLFLKRTPFHSGPVFNLLGLSSAVAVVAAIWIHRAPRLPWALIAAGLTTFVAGDVLAYNYQRFFGHQLPFPSVADGFYLATGPLLTAGLILLIRRRNPAHDRAALIDALIVSMSASAVSWTLLIAPYVHDSTLSLSTKLTSVAYPFVDLALAACVARLALGQGRHSPALAFLTVGVLCLLGTDSIYGWALLHNGYTTGGLLDGGWIAFYLLIGAAALHPSAQALVEPARDTQFQLTRSRIAGLSSCAMVTPIVLIVEGTGTAPRDVALLAACSAAVFLLVFVRLLDLGKRHRAGLRRATVLAEAGSGLVEARTVEEVGAVASKAGNALLGNDGEVTIGESDGLLVSPTANAAVDADTMAGLRTLADVVALALDGIELADQLMRQKAEEAEQVLGETEEQLRQSQKMDAVGNLAGGIAHDFNNLLTAINGYAALLQDEPGNTRTNEFANAIGEAGERAAALTQQLLAFSRRQLLRPDVMSLNGVVVDMASLLGRLIGDRITIDLELDPDLQRTEADRGKLDQVLLNLVVNARDATADGGTVTISTRNEANLVVLEVSDTGVGMDQTTADRIFEPFFTTKDVGTGTGLGLSTVYGIVTQTGGTIDVQSAPGEGATFTVRLPVTLRDFQAIADDLELAPGGNERVLIVDDEQAICDVLAAALRSQGYDVTTATSAAEPGRSTALGTHSSRTSLCPALTESRSPARSTRLTHCSCRDTTPKD